MAAQLTEQLDAVQPWQLAVGDDQVGQLAPAAGQGGFAIREALDMRIRACRQYQLCQEVGGPGVGLGNQNIGYGSRGKHGELDSGKIMASNAGRAFYVFAEAKPAMPDEIPPSIVRQTGPVASR